MKKRFFSVLFAAVALCALAFSSFIAPAVGMVAATGRALNKLVLDGFKLAVPENEGTSAVVVAFVQAKAFLVRLAKRERPVVTGAWRMCPST